VVIVDTTRGRDEVIGEMDFSSAKQLVFDHAIYIHLGDQFVVRNLDLENRRCYVEAADTDYWTDSIVKTDIKVLSEDEERPVAGVRTVLGDVLVRTQATKFKKLKYRTNENIGYGDVDLPADEMHTRSAVLLFDEGSPLGKRFAALPLSDQGILVQRLGVLLRTVSPVFLLCDARDLGVAERVRDPHFDAPCIFVYDQYPGGIGLSEGLLKNLAPIVRGAEELVRTCPCENGCPSCIGAPDSLTPAPEGPEGAAPAAPATPVPASPALLAPVGIDAKKTVRDYLAAWVAALEG
ncbi:MAG TPA: Zn-binding domain-containing protein, partial [Spirochaetia bacterium]